MTPMREDTTVEIDAEATDGGFIPSVRISRRSREIFAHQCPIVFADKRRALLYAGDYAEVALSAFRAR